MPEIAASSVRAVLATPLLVGPPEIVLAVPSPSASRGRPTLEVVATSFSEVLAISLLVPFEMRHASSQKILTIIYVLMYAVQKRPYEGRVRATKSVETLVHQTHGRPIDNGNLSRTKIENEAFVHYFAGVCYTPAA